MSFVVELNETIHPLEISDAPPSPLPMLPITQSSGINTQIDDSHTPRDPLFIHPEAFRPNSYFVGRVEELKDLHHILYDKKRRSEGTSTALIRCQTGGGKTHMARQYVFEHRYDYPGGIFWLRASTIQELEDEFWRIARTVALRDLKDAGTDIKDLQDHTKVVDHVRRWFNGFENWLLVLDGIMFDPGIERFVPDAANTSMILTSTSPAGSGDHHFNNAKLLELPLLSTQEAQELLLLEMEKRKPWTRDDLKQAADLVHLLERLPLMIHVTAQHLKTTYEPLATFLRRYKNKPHVGKIPAYEFVLEQLRARGAMAALNVLSVLAFFEQHTPVEMMALGKYPFSFPVHSIILLLILTFPNFHIGLRALDKSTPYKTRDAVTHLKPSLNNTLRVLIAFALVERTDSYDLSPTSSRTSKKSLDLPSESMDTLRMHSVIQRYFIESLAEKREHVFWLGRSVGVFCKAFEEADARIKDNPKIGLPDDYKRFLLHGKKLLSHLNHYERRSPEELQPLRKQLEEKLPQIEAEAERLHKEIQAKIVGGGKSGGDTIHQTSIFDRANSLSESDSGTTSSQSHSQQMWTPTDEVGYPEYFVSPIATDSEHLYNAYGLPYPLDDDDDITPTPHDTPKPGFNQTSLPEDQGNWQTVPEYHRRQQKKSSTLLSNGKDDYKSPAEVGVSRYIAQAPQRGSHFSSRDSLAEIRKHSPTPPRGGGGIKGTRSPSSGNGTRPTGLLITGSNHYGGVASGLTPTDEPSHAEFSMAYATIPAPGTSMAAVTQRFNGTAAAAGRSGRKLSNESSGGKSTLAPTSTHTSPGIDQLATMPPFPVLTTRSAKSSPGQGISPFYPPDLPIERHSNSSLRRPANPPPSFHHWNTTSYHPGLGLPRVESSSLGEESMAMSFPLPDRTLRRQPGAVFSPSSSAAAAAVWPVADYAVSTTPMSRDSSHPSSNPSYNSRHRSTDSIRGVTNNNNNMNIVIPSSTDRDRGRRYSSPLSSPVSSVMPPNRLSATAAAGGGGGNNNNNNSRPTSIMTEPSPRITPRFDLIDPPYQSLLSNNNNNSSITIPMPTATARNNRPRAGSQSNNITGAVFPSSMGTNLSTALSPPPPPPQQQQQPTRRQSRYKRAWGKLRSNSRRGRSSSHSSSVSAGGRNSVHSSPGPGATPSFSSPPPSPPTFAMGVGGEPMGRSGSGGIIIGGGVGGGRRQIIEFGEVPIDIGVASHRLRERQQHQQHQQQQQQKENMAPPMSRSSSGGVGLGIMPEGEMR